MKKHIMNVLIGQCIWGLLPLFWLLLQQVPALYILANRIIWSAVLCVIILFLQKKFSLSVCLRQIKKEWLYILGACLMITCNWAIFIYSMTHEYILQSSLAYFVNPVVVIFFGGILFHEPLSRLQKLAVFFASLGFVIAIFLYGEVPYVAILTCATWAAYSLLKKRITLDSLLSVGLESISMVPFALLFIFFSEWNHIGAYGVLTGWQWLLLPATGPVTAIPMLFFTAGIKYAPITVSGICLYVSPTLSLIIGLLTGEAFTIPLQITFFFTGISIILYLTGLFLQYKQ